jgi:hypothetical protein
MGKRIIAAVSTAVAVVREWLDLRTLHAYSGISERTLRNWIHRDSDPLPASQPQNKIMVRRSAFDAWMERQVVKKNLDVDSLVEEIVSSVRN